MKGFIFLYQQRRVLWATTLSDVKSRYAGTVFGILWALIYPVIFLGLYAVVYIMIFKIRLGELTTVDYVLVIFSGLIPFLGFAEALSAGVSSVVNNKNLIKNTLFPIELIPVKAVLSSAVTMLVGLLILLAILWSKGEIHVTQLAIPLILFLQLIFTIGLIWWLSALNVLFQDIGQMIAVVILLLMLVSPIAYTADMIPPELMPLMYPNPLYYMIMLYREVIIFGSIPYDLLLMFITISLLMFVSGFYFFTRLKPVFSDYV